MNELNKLIEQWCEEEGTPAFMIHALIKEVEDEKGTWLNKLLLWLASRPTCGEEQRKFLDEICAGYYDKHDDTLTFEDSVLYEYDFKADISKVIKGE